MQGRLNITAVAIRLYNPTLRLAPSLTSYVSLFYFRESESPLFFTTVAMPVQSSYGGLRSERRNRASHKDCKNNPQWFVASLIVLCWVSRHCVSCKARACWVSARAYQPSVQFPQDSKRGHSNQPP
jgi:hypothetical protein